MANLKFTSVIYILLFTSFISVTKSQNWPCWRGPNQDGISTESNLPTKWDSVTNIVWKTKVPGIGYSSPIIWENKLFTLSALPETQERILLCYESNSGKLLWQETFLKAPLEDKHKDNSYASGTPATDGNLVYISFLDDKDVVVAAYDFSGNRIWIQRPGTSWSEWGYSCSPRIYNDMVIINGNSRGEAPFVAAMSKTDGKILWKVDHEKSANNFSTPIIKRISGKTQMIFCGNQEISSYNPDNGEQNWFVDGPSKDFCSSPVYDEKNDLVIVSSAWPRRILVAIKPNGQGNVTESHVIWSSTEGAVYVPSLITIDDYLFSTMTNGNVHCIDVTTGKVLWKEELGSQYSSPVWAGGLLYMPNDDGIITVIKPGPEFETVAKNSIGEKMFASPAISNGKIFLRGEHHLFCIGH
jgi:outer membrane protein assembly factor BamB